MYYYSSKSKFEKCSYRQNKDKFCECLVSHKRQASEQKRSESKHGRSKEEAELQQDRIKALKDRSHANRNWQQAVFSSLPGMEFILIQQHVLPHCPSLCLKAASLRYPCTAIRTHHQPACLKHRELLHGQAQDAPSSKQYVWRWFILFKPKPKYVSLKYRLHLN